MLTTVTYILQSRNFASYLEEVLLYKHHTYGLCPYDPKFDLKLKVGHCNLHFTVQLFCLISWRVLEAQTSFLWIMNQYDQKFYLKLNVNHSDLHFTAQ